MDAQLSSSNTNVLFAPWYPIVPAVPAPERICRSYGLVKCALNSGHVWLTSSIALNFNIALEYREVSWIEMIALSTICSAEYDQRALLQNILQGGQKIFDGVTWIVWGCPHCLVVSFFCSTLTYRKKYVGDRGWFAGTNWPFTSLLQCLH